MVRIVSLLPGATEIVCALGLEADLVGRSHECDFPPSVAALPVVSKPRLDPSASSAAIDRAVKTLVSQGLGVFEIDAERLRALQPDIIITQIQCEVCAVSEDDVRHAVSDWLVSTPTIVSVTANSMDEVWHDIEVVARALDREAAGSDLVTRLQQRLETLTRSVGSSTSKSLTPAPSMLGIEWVQPLMASGNWIPELMTLAGARPVLAGAGQHSPWITWDDITRTDPDIIIVSPCGFSLERAASEVTHLRALPGWSELNAVRNERVFAFEGHHYLHRPGPRLVDSAEYLARIVAGKATAADGAAYRHIASNA